MFRSFADHITTARNHNWDMVVRYTQVPQVESGFRA
jgi:hypothetical protein